MTARPADADMPDLPARWTYGPTALATPANALTTARLVAAPFLIAIIWHEPVGWGTWGVWVVLAGTDGIDGWLARRHGTTRSGAFLDPLADKALVLGALYALVVKGPFTWFPVSVIALREVGISVYRVVAARHGVSVPARKLAKVKTFVQALAVGLAVWPVTGRTAPIAEAALWLAVGLTVYTGGQYLLEARSKMGAVTATADGEPSGGGGTAAGTARQVVATSPARQVVDLAPASAPAPAPAPGEVPDPLPGAADD